MWGAKGYVGVAYDALTVWRAYAEDVQGHAIDSGHFLPEEAPTDTITALRQFLA